MSPPTLPSNDLVLPPRSGLTQRTQSAAADALAGRRRGPAALLPFLGPAFIASVAYMDPGNFATNIQAGASFGYNLLWVVLFANLAAILFQAISARLGIATGRNLAELCRDHIPRPAAYAMWVVAEIAAMATDLAEFLGATIALNLLLGLPLLVGTVCTAIATYGMLLLQGRGFRPVEMLIAGLIAVMSLSYLAELLMSRPDWAAVGYHTMVPWLNGPDSVLLTAGIVGATVMPHAIYLHSGLTQNRIIPASREQARRLSTYSNIEVVIALGLAGLVNMAMMIMAAAVFHDGRHNDVASIETAYHTLGPLLGRASAAVFLVSLLASGLSSSVVGTMAGQMVMQGFVGFKIPLWLRRLATMAPSVAIIALGVDTTRALVVSQVVLSLALPLPMISLIAFARQPRLMGHLVIPAWSQVLAATAATLIMLLNLALILETFDVPLFGG